MTEETSETTRAAGEPDWVLRFRTPQLMTVRPVAGDADTALVIENQPADSRGRIWRSDPAGGEARWSPELPYELGYDALLTRDGEWVVTLSDDGGSEVGGLVALSTTGEELVELTPGYAPYVVRGMDLSADGLAFLATTVDDDGFHLVVVPASPWGAPRTIWSSRNESWWGRISADGAVATVDTTDHNPGWRRTAVTCIDTSTGAVIAVCDDTEAGGPVRAVRFSPLAHDQRVLLSTERSGYARPAIWSPLDGDRVDFALPEFPGDLHPLDWSPQASRVLLLHTHEGIQRLLVLDTDTGEARVAREGSGSYAQPDVASELSYYSQSYLGQDGRVLSVEQAWHRPASVVEIAIDGAVRTVIEPADVPEGIPFTSEMVTSEDGTPVQLWWALPRGEARGTVLIIHGGPNLVTSDGYDPAAQAWLAEGFAVAAINYRGSVLFGRDFREGFWVGHGDREIADLRAGVLRLRELGVAAPESTFISGPSYGGHLTLLSLGRLPEMFAGGFAFVAMADWEAAFADMNAALRPVWQNVLSNSELTFEEACAKISAISYVSEVRGSAWLCQGARDTRTPPVQAQNYADRLREAGGDVLLDWFDAGHEPSGLAVEEAWQHRMLELADLALAGRRWSTEA
ncbi:prolyl oligopeptidase family serine peptidase [Leucobacter celer]|uniref:prolyl oligopeptidase family serine peptidase n=1 Tax=Leucobacter celer TaxID=668625 RepID=UPI0006A793A6|nr:prolyl oligopeptidase family serine peptidase [Leucobacter celer]